LADVVAELVPVLGADCPVAVVYRASWPDQVVTLATLGSISVPPQVERTALILVGRALAQEGFDESRLYAADYDRRYRPLGDAPRFPEAP
jgi:precorrin-4/cobalt-precorrin-4 C11-methyltransferase